MKASEIKEWIDSPVTQAYFRYLEARIKALKSARGEGSLMLASAEAMFRANWEFEGGLKELQAMRDVGTDEEQIYEVFGVENAI